MEPKNGYEDWEITVMLSNALGYPMKYKHASEIMDEVAKLTPTFKGVSFKKLDERATNQANRSLIGCPTSEFEVCTALT